MFGWMESSVARSREDSAAESRSKYLHICASRMMAIGILLSLLEEDEPRVNFMILVQDSSTPLDCPEDLIHWVPLQKLFSEVDACEPGVPGASISSAHLGDLQRALGDAFAWMQENCDPSFSYKGDHHGFKLKAVTGGQK